jgi:hypothetical protein
VAAPATKKISSTQRLAALAAACILTLLVTACGSASQRPSTAARWNFGTLAGYIWEGHVTAVGASWYVPAVREQSPKGLAGTWVGAQEKFGHSAPFIQVGVDEDQLGPSRQPESTKYYAFWSDDAHDFKPVDLFEVTPLTEVHAILRLSRGKWSVSIRDGEESAEFTTPQEGRARFTLALWLQEDRGPVPHRNDEPSKPGPYPDLGTVHFTHLSVNDTPPSYSQVASQWLTAAHMNFGPTPLINDEFEIGPRQITTAGAEYLRLADMQDLASERLEAEFNKWGREDPREPTPAMESARRAGVAATAHFIDGLEHYKWPSNASLVIGRLITVNRRLLALERVPFGSGRDFLQHWFRRLDTGLGNVPALVRRALGVPQFRSGSAECTLSLSSPNCAPSIG